MSLFDVLKMISIFIYFFLTNIVIEHFIFFLFYQLVYKLWYTSYRIQICHISNIKKYVFMVLYGMFFVNKEDMSRIWSHFVLAFHVEISCLQMLHIILRLSAWCQVWFVVWTASLLLAWATCSAVYTPLDLIQTSAVLYT